MAYIKFALNYRVLAFLALTTAVGTVSRVGGDPLLFTVGAAGLAGGNIYMWRTGYAVSRLRTGVLLLLLIVLLFYLGRDMLFSWTNDPLLLARYLVYGLIVTGFDLRTRRNVMGTLVLAGMLMVLLSQMAFDVWFPALVGLFVLLALGAAAAGHIEEEARRAVVVGGRLWSSSVKVWAGFIFGFLLLTAAVFVLMPRFGFGTLAQAGWLPSRIDLTIGGPSRLPNRPSARVSSDFLVTQQFGQTGLDGYVPLGYTGSAADSPVMHVRSRMVTYWRGGLLDEYDGVGWLPSVTRMTLVDDGRSEYVFADSNQGLRSRRWYAQTYYILVDQPNAVFTGYNPGRLYLPRSSQTSLNRGTVYRAISRMPRLNPDQLRRDLVDPRDVDNLVLPPIGDNTAELAESIVAGAATDFDKAVRLEQFLTRNYRYDLSVKPLTPGRDAVETFLFQEQSGYCAQFATAMAVMARHVGLPARVAVGYLPGVYNPMTGAFTVRSGDAHAWVEVHFRNNGWVVFDPTPRPDLPKVAGLGGGWITFGLLDFAGVNFTGAFSSLTDDWSVGALSIPGWVWFAALGAAAVVGAVAGLLVSRRTGSAEQDGHT